MRAHRRRLLSFTVTRGVLVHLAPVLAGLEHDESRDALTTIIAELSALRDGDTTADVWEQAVSGLDGPQSYGLERIGLWPGTKDEL